MPQPVGEQPHSVPPTPGPMNWFSTQLLGQAVKPGDEKPTSVTLTLVRIDHGHGQFRGVFAPWDLENFGRWVLEQAKLAETNIQVVTELPTGWPPGLVPPNGRPS